MISMDQLCAIKIKEIWAYLKTQDASFWLINIYLFFEYVRPQTLYPVIDIIPYAQIVLILTIVLFFLKKDHIYTKNIINKLLIFYFIIVIASSINALSPDAAYDKLSIFISWMIIYFLIVNIVNTEKRFLIFVLAFCLYSFKMSQFSFLNWLMSGFSFTNIGSGGGPGWFHNSGEFGIQMVIFLSISICFVYALRTYWPKWKQFLMFLFPLTALSGTVSSSSRGAVLGAAAVGVFFMLKSKYKVKGIVVLALVSLVVFSMIPDRQMARFEAMGEDDTSINRLVLWERGLELISMYPMQGVGYQNWTVASEKIFGIEKTQVCHNIFIECASELGYPGLFVFLLMILYTFINNYKTRKIIRQSGRSNKFLFFMAHGLDGALVGYLVSGFFVTVLYYPYFWINLAMTVSLREISRKMNCQRNQEDI